jgi:hypothetical protein
MREEEYVMKKNLKVEALPEFAKRFRESKVLSSNPYSFHISNRARRQVSSTGENSKKKRENKEKNHE